MCCFSGLPVFVGATRIFARGEGDWQYVAYEMAFKAEEPVAMVLPLPVMPSNDEASLRFLDLSGYPRFFRDLHRAFDAPPMRGSGGGGLRDLVVHRVGAFEASFVPNRKAFARLDERFRLDDRLLALFMGMPDEGFAVFKLAGAAEVQRAHPMAFAYRRRDRNRLVFPTLHVHDGTLHAEATFDHALYWQAERAPDRSDWTVPEAADLPWESPVTHPSRVVDAKRAAGVFNPAQGLYRLSLLGRGPNADVWVRARGV
ncbi:MAG: hypothetical protein U0325_05105 [Polyangiales bacterium]